MRKVDELSNPQSCMTRADDYEMTFVLLARDVAAPETIRDWCSKRIAHGKNTWTDPQIREALSCANEMERQFEARKRRTP